MPAPKLAPSVELLRDYRSRRLTQQQMVDEYFAQTGIKLSRSAFAMAMHRAGLTDQASARHTDLLPWTLRPEHRYHRDARYLRLESRRRQGEVLAEDQLRRLTAWKTEMQERNAVIYYDPDSPGGWWWIERTEHDNELIRRPEALIPWDVKPEHQEALEYRLLSLEVRRRLGEALGPEERAFAQRGILELESEDTVIIYSPESGWSRSPRTDGDADFVRSPSAQEARPKRLKRSAPRGRRRLGQTAPDRE